MSDPFVRWAPDLATRLEVLRAAVESEETQHAEIPIPDLPVGCHVGMEAGGRVWIRIQCDPHAVATDDRAAAVQFTVTPTGYRVSVAPYTVEAVRNHLLEEMIQLLVDGHEPGDVGRAALQNWRELLARPPGPPLSESALVGLFGELEVLETVLDQGGDLDHWTGWSRDQSDFRMPGLVIEVKSTLSPNYRRVRIHGLSQLADPEDGSTLVLVLKRLEPSPEGRSVPDVIEAVVRRGASRATLLDRLAHANYSDQHRAIYAQPKFVSREIALRQVDHGHARLVPEMLKGVDLSCIDRIDYELNLNGDADADLDSDLATLVATYLEDS